MAPLKTYFEFVQFSLGIKEELPAMDPQIDWVDFFRFAQKQSLLGVVFDGISKLPKEHAPDTGMLMQWMGKSIAIKNRNMLMYMSSAEVYAEIRKRGFECCVLKGQGNAIYYPNPYSRASGDVDIWVLSSREELRTLAMAIADSPDQISREIMHHIELSRKGVSVELHPTPMILNNPILNRRMQHWMKRSADLQCSNRVDLPDNMGQIAIPTPSFNAVYQLSHLYHHFFYEGVGLRQIIDYYHVLNQLNRTNDPVLQRDLKHLGLWSFCGAVMYVLHVVLGLPEDRAIVPMDVQRGRMLLEEILQGGNFGQYDTRGRSGNGTMRHNIQRFKRDLRLMRYYPEEALAEPFFRLWHFFWRITNRKRFRDA